ncbi:glycosyltransferase family 2 protein [Labrys okinawensis]|uniref:glycosyltransferase family 2 protein n=1 Tax=Labrys okinawensis TaxID=346911 RepID=UPI0039BD7F3B
MIRTKPFREHCALPVLPGKQPFGGHLLSHDFVEAALLARAGWDVWFLPQIEGSYEENPPTLLDELKRDRRWAQGNTQHLGLLLADGLRSAHKFLFFNGAMAFLAAPLWGVFLVLSVVWAFNWNVVGHGLALLHFFRSFPLPPWWMFGLTLVFLFAPKFLAIVIAARSRSAWDYGGIDKIFIGVIVESALSILISPIKMLYHSLFVIQSLLGKSVKWGPQIRDDRGMVWSDAIHYFGWCTGIGVGTWMILYRLVASSRLFEIISLLRPHLMAMQFLIWLAPILGGMALSVPVAVLTSRNTWGQWLRRKSIFLTPEENNPPDELSLQPFSDERLENDPFVQAVVDPQLNAVHVALQRPRSLYPQYLARIVEKALTEGPGSLTETERNVVLCDRQSMMELHWAVWGLTKNRHLWHGAELRQTGARGQQVQSVLSSR